MRKSGVNVNAFLHEKIPGSWKIYMISENSTIQGPPIPILSNPGRSDQLDVNT